MTVHSEYEKLVKDEKLVIADSMKTIYKDIRNFLSGRVSGATRDEVLFNEFIKIIYCKMYDETQYLEVKKIRFHYGWDSSDIEVYKKIQQIYSDLKTEHRNIFDEHDNINLNPSTVRYIVQNISPFFFRLSKRDPVGDAFEIFYGSQLRGSEGQFFTPRNVIEMIVAILDPKQNQAIIDPACGTGGFLSASLNYMVNKNGFNSISDIKEMIENCFMGIDKDETLAKIAQKQLAILGNCNPNILCKNSLTTKLQKQFDILMTNPPFGSNINALNETEKKDFKLAHRWKLNKKTGEWEITDQLQPNTPPQILFVEKCIDLVKEQGLIGIVLPESTLSSPNYKYVVTYIVQKCKVKAVISMPEELFKTSGKSGTHTKTCVLILQKNHIGMKSNDEIFMANAKWCGHNSRGMTIPYDDLPLITEKYLLRKRKNDALSYHILFKNIIDGIFVPKYYNPNFQNEYDVIEKTNDISTIQSLADQNIISITSGDEIGKLSYGTGDIPFIRSSDISNWEVKADPKHYVNKEIYLKYKDKQDIRPLDILFVKDGTYLVGTVAMITDYDTEMIYQSHIYKIRCLKPDILNPYLLLAILNSNFVKDQIKSKRFSQDIIESIGKRIFELTIPIPKDEKKREKIISDVKTVIDSRMNSKKLIRKINNEIY